VSCLSLESIYFSDNYFSTEDTYNRNIKTKCLVSLRMNCLSWNQTRSQKKASLLWKLYKNWLLSQWILKYYADTDWASLHMENDTCTSLGCPYRKILLFSSGYLPFRLATTLGGSSRANAERLPYGTHQEAGESRSHFIGKVLTSIGFSRDYWTHSRGLSALTPCIWLVILTMSTFRMDILHVIDVNRHMSFNGVEL
jgi:hypothetical protein